MGLIPLVKLEMKSGSSRVKELRENISSEPNLASWSPKTYLRMLKLSIFVCLAFLNKKPSIVYSLSIASMA